MSNYYEPKSLANNYEMRSSLASQATESARAGFIRRTYGHLAGAILAFVAIEAALLQLPGIGQVVGAMTTGYMWLVVLVAFMGVGTLANYWAQSDTSRELQYAGLALYTIAEAVIFLPLLYIASHFFPNTPVIQIAGILTLAVFAGLTVTVFITQKDFSYLGPILTIGSLLALGFMLAGIFFGFTLGLFFCLAMVALISGYILFYTSAVLHTYRTDQHVAASLALFASVATLFWYILQIVMMSSRD
jgi:hypothetical protein